MFTLRSTDCARSPDPSAWACRSAAVPCPLVEWVKTHCLPGAILTLLWPDRSQTGAWAEVSVPKPPSCLQAKILPTGICCLDRRYNWVNSSSVTAHSLLLRGCKPLVCSCCKPLFSPFYLEYGLCYYYPQQTYSSAFLQVQNIQIRVPKLHF